MSDVPCEAFMLARLALFLWSWRRPGAERSVAADFLSRCLAGSLPGLSLLSKFNGFLGLMIIAAWSGLTLIAPGLKLGRKLDDRRRSDRGIHRGTRCLRRA